MADITGNDVITFIRQHGDAGLWSRLVNPDFFIPNTGNTRMDKSKVGKEYKELLSEVED